MNYYDTYASPLGTLTIASDGQYITGLWMDGQKHFLLPEQSVSCRDIAVIHAAKKWLDDYFLGNNTPLDGIPLLPTGTDFQKEVWSILMRIPYGQTVTYGEIAAAMGKEKMSAQAVGNAVGRNPISILIPCHRVIGAKGLTGYAGGIARKEYLLQLERTNQDTHR